MDQWMDGVIAYNIRKRGTKLRPSCFHVSGTRYKEGYGPEVHSVLCGIGFGADYICEYVDDELTHSSLFETVQRTKVTLSDLPQNDEDLNFENFILVKCPLGHMTHSFLACDLQSACWANDLDFDSSGSCRPPLAAPLPPHYACADGVAHVPYTMVCDHRSDCADHSDETFCSFPTCRGDVHFDCGDGQCVPRSARCDGPTDCVSGLDERQCAESAFGSGTVLSLPPPALVLLDGRGSFTTTVLNSTHDGHTLCPDTHFQCPHDGYCLPVYVRCNGVYDCPGREDEADCSAFACPGFYRCRASVICLHVSHLCDGFYQCPQHDDELFCRVACPETCTCVGLSLFCRSRFEVGEYPEIRFLDASGTGMTTVDAANNSLLIHLGLAGCGLADLEAVFMPNLRSLDLSDNELKYLSLDVLRLLSNLQTLVLAGNPLSMPFNSSSFAHHHSSLRVLDLSRIPITVLKLGYLGVFPNVQSLNLSYTSVQRVAGEGFQSLRKLRVLDLRGCPMASFPKDLFQGLVFLSRVQADNYKLCCPAVLPRGFNVLNCRAPSDEISSCDALLRSDVFRVFLSVFAALALLGNLGSFVYRVFLLKASSQLGFGVFVTHLCVSDFLMGVYLLIIGVADRLYQGAYLWNDTAWKESGFCRVAGFLSLLSSEVSAFLVCLITLDRCLVLKFPFSRLRFRKRSAHVACALAWTAGLVLSTVPLLPVTSHWHFYSQTGICIPLPITRKAFPGHFYSFAIMITFNFALFILIALGQAFIYWSVTTNRMSSSDTSRKSQDLTIARRLITVAVSDFLCWFPIGLLGSLAAYSGVAIPSGVNVAMAIFVLPLNSALNPFLYTINILLERRRIAKERRLEKRLMVELQTNSSRLETTSKTVKVVTEAKAMEMIQHFLAEGVLRKEVVSDLLGKDTCDTKI